MEHKGQIETPVSVQPLVDRRNQAYAMAANVSLYGLWVCEGCGCLVGDREQHNLWHTKTRSTV